MQASLPRPSARRWQRVCSTAGVFLLGVALTDCASNSSSSCDSANQVNECSNPGAACPGGSGYAKFCALSSDRCVLQCLNVCNNPTDFASGSVATGGTCEFDDDCQSGSSCDNDVVGGSATCKCVTTPTCSTSLDVAFWGPLVPAACTAADYVHDFGGTLGEWELKRTCRRVDGTCTETDDNIGIGRDAGDTTQLCWVDDSNAHADGQLCDSDFSFAETPLSGEYETGIFHFSTSTDLEADWIIYDRPDGAIVARCKGKGRENSQGAPDDPPNCQSYDPFGTSPGGTTYDGIFNERYSCVQLNTCVDQDESSQIIITRGAGADSYLISSPDGFYNGSATRVGSALFWGASYHDPSAPDQDYTETGSYGYADSDNFGVQSAYKITGTGVTGTCTGKARRNAIPPAPDPFPPCQ